MTMKIVCPTPHLNSINSIGFESSIALYILDVILQLLIAEGPVYYVCTYQCSKLDHSTPLIWRSHTEICSGHTVCEQCMESCKMACSTTFSPLRV